VSNARPELELEAEGGAVPLGSRFYVTRPTDADFRGAVGRRDGIVLVKGPRQVGKTSLLARGLQKARAAGDRVVLIDFQSLSAANLASLDALCLALAGILAEQLDLDEYPDDDWDPARGANANITRFLTGPVFRAVQGPLVLGLDEVDRVFTTSCSDEFFALFRGWYNRRALEPHAPWDRLTLAISFATEAHLFIRDLNQSPFNVGTRVTLRDFLPEEVADLNERYGSPLQGTADLERYYRLLGGHPFLTRKGLHDLVLGATRLDDLERSGDGPDAPFGDHLRRMLVLLERDPEIRGELSDFVHRRRVLSEQAFHRLRGAGLVAGSDAACAVPRCQLYAEYLARHLA
jgi:hypothetical protein